MSWRDWFKLGNRARFVNEITDTEHIVQVGEVRDLHIHGAYPRVPVDPQHLHDEYEKDKELSRLTRDLLQATTESQVRSIDFRLTEILHYFPADAYALELQHRVRQVLGPYPSGCLGGPLFGSRKARRWTTLAIILPWIVGFLLLLAIVLTFRA